MAASARPLALVAMLAVTGLAVASWRIPGPPPGGPEGIAAELGELGIARTTGARLSFAPRHRPCPDAEPAEGTVPRAVCPDGDPGGGKALRELERAVAAAVRAGDAGALHAAALLDLMAADPTGEAADSAVSRLRAAAAAAPRPAAALADLAAAYLARAAARQSPRDLLEAVEAAERALRADSTHLSARFNLALALERHGLVSEAREAWMRYADADPLSSWGREAAARAAAMAIAPPPEAPAAEDSATLAAFAARWPREARAFGWEVALGRWGSAALEGDADGSARQLAVARVLGRALVRRGGDATLADAVDAIARHRDDGPALRLLAAGHVDYSEAQVLWARIVRDSAGHRFERILGSRPPSPALVAWASVFHAAALSYTGEPHRAVPLLGGVIARAPVQRWPALLGRAHWHLGSTTFRAGDTDGALAPYLQASFYMRTAGEDEYVGATEAFRGDAELTMGNTAGWAMLQGAVRRTRQYPRSQWRYTALYALARGAADDGMPAAAMHAQEEGMVAARARPTDVFVLESRILRARTLAASGDTAGAERELAAVEPRIVTLSSESRAYMVGDLRLLRGLIGVGRGRPAAVADLDTAITTFLVAHPMRVPPALAGRARARLAAGDVARATADVEQMIQLLAQRAAPDSVMTARRETTLAGGRDVVDAVALRHLAAGRATEALAVLGRGRAALRGEASPDAGGMPATRSGETAVRLALVGDTLLAWTTRAGGAVALAGWPVDGAALREDAARLRAALERRDDATALPALDGLYARLLAPIAARLGPPGTDLVLRVDEELAGIPFAALRAPGGRYLVQDHRVRLAGPSGPAHGAAPRDGGAPLFVAEPWAGGDGGARVLAGARREALAAAASYPGARVLEGRAATREATAAAMQRASLIHFAGHAVLDDARPERSYLVVAPGEGVVGGDARLTAAALGGMDLRRARLVVLAACGTLGAPEGAATGFSGLTGAVLTAGAGGVVGSLWRVEDARTEALMGELHRAYRGGGDGAAALRAAQLRMLASPDPALRAPSAWAGFQYVGR